MKLRYVSWVMLACLCACISETRGQWIERHSTSFGTLTDVVMLDTATAIAVGRNREILRTTNGGVTWIDLGAPLSSAAPWNGVAFYDSLHGIIVGDHGLVRTTTDGGKMWFWRQVPGVWTCYSAVFLNDTNIYVGADSGWIHHTLDGGSTWTSERASRWPVRSMFTVKGIPFFGPPVFALTPYSLLSKIDLSAPAWSESTLTQFRGLGSEAFDGEIATGGASGFIVGVQGDLRAAPAVIRFTLNDLSGTNIASGIHRDGTLRGVSVPPNTSTVFVCGSNGMLYRSSDGGTTWTDQSVQTRRSVNAIFFLDSLHGIAVGDSGLILTTTRGGVTGVDRVGSVLPQDFKLEQNFPNPFNPSTQIAYEIAQSARVTIGIYDVLGRTIRLLEDGERMPGRYKLEWDGRTLRGEPAVAGVYLCRMRAGAYQSAVKLVLTR